jgi:hypothetical protein
MLLQNGTIDESNKTVALGSGWGQAKPFQIVNFADADGHVRLRTTGSRIYEVEYNQVFILEQSPSDAYAFQRSSSAEPILVTIRTERLSR